MKILITGSNGLLGQKLVDLLCEKEDADVIATSRGENRLPSSEKYSFHSLNITSKSDIAYVFEKYQPDMVINTAAMTQVEKTSC